MIGPFSSVLSASAAPAGELLAPALIFVLAAAGAVGMILLLPGRREVPIRTIGGILLSAVGIIFAVQAAKLAAGMGAYFWIFAAIAIIGAVRVVTHPRPVYSALYFVLTVMASARLFVLMWAEFMAAALVLIYAGAILVTYVFVIMLASEATPGGTSAMRQQVTEHDAVSREPVIASAVGFALLGVLLFAVFDRATPTSGSATDLKGDNSFKYSYAMTQFVTTAPSSGGADANADAGFRPEGGTQRLGSYLFDKQLVNLELAGLILTVAMVGAIVIARKKVINPLAEPAGTETLTAPMTPIDDNPHSIPVYGTENPRQKEYPET